MRRRILVVLIAMTSAAVIALFIPASIALRDADRKDQQIELQAEAFTAAGQFESTNSIVKLEEHEFAVYGADGRLIQGDGPDVADRAVTTALAGAPTVVLDGDYVVAALPLTEGRVLRATEDCWESDLSTFISVIELGAVALAIIAFAVLAAVLLSRRMNKPLAALAASAQQLGNGDFSVHAPASGVAEIDDVSTALNSASEQLANLVSRERKLTSEASHQLRTPLAGMRVAVEAELSAPRGDRSEVMGELLSAIDRMDGAITSLIALNRDVKPEACVADAADIVHRAAQRWEKPLGAAGRVIVTESADDYDLLTTARPAAIDAVLDVLLDNALVHGSGDVSIRLEFLSGAPVIRLADKGCFVSESSDPFATTARPGDQHGIGLGMARTLTEAESGRVRLVLRDPTTFEVILPSAANPEPESSSRGNPRSTIAG